MHPPKRSDEPRRTQDAVVRALAAQAVNDAVMRGLRKVAVWLILGGLATVGGAAWTASAWATNQRRDTESNTIRITSWEQASREQVQAMAELKSAVDSLRITLQERAR